MDLKATKNVKQIVAQQIRDARISKGLTLKELGGKLGVSESAASRYEAGKQNLTIETLQKIADTLGLQLKVTLD